MKTTTKYKINTLFFSTLCAVFFISACSEQPLTGVEATDEPREEVRVGGTLDEAAPEEHNSSAPEEAEPEAPTVVEAESELAMCPDPGVYKSYDSCCEEAEAYCLPSDTIPGGLSDQLDACGTAGTCVPGVILDSMSNDSIYDPRVCESLGGKAGVCLSVCIPKVRDVMALLPQDICTAAERCTPCIDPISGEETGACSGSVPCEQAPDGGSKTESAEEEVVEAPATPQPTYSCDMPPEEPIVDVNLFDPCCEGSHCVPKDLVPQEEHEMLAGCNGDAGFCVPDPMVESGGFYVPKTCESVSGVEGRCLSTCLPNVAEQEANLPVDICEANERCAPCCDPFTGESTGACDRGCDVGPESGMCEGPIYDSCCGGMGHCIEPELLPEDKLGNVEKCKGENKGLVCVPDQMHDPNYAGDACVGQGLLGNYEGVCLPECLKIFLKITLDDSTCEANHKCVPCVGPLGKPTGAPGCPQ